MNDFKQDIVNLIKESRINTAILRLADAITDEKVKEDLILIESRYNRIVAADLSNIQSFDDLDKYYSKVTKDLLSIVNTIDDRNYKKKSHSEELSISKREIELLLSENNRLKHQLEKNLGIIKGKRLFQYQGIYPIDLEAVTDIPRLNKETYVNAIKYFLQEDIYDRLAASDIVYLRQDNLNSDEDILDDKYIDHYVKLVEKYDLFEFIENFKQENEALFNNYIRIANEFGVTLHNCHLEILLHNVRNPIRSIIAAQNTSNISNRKLYDPSTRFVVEYVKNQGRNLIKAFEGRGKISYEKVFKNGKKVKATTTPIFDYRYGLIGILCINIDIDAVMKEVEKGQYTFIDNYCNIIDKEEKNLSNIL